MLNLKNYSRFKFRAWHIELSKMTISPFNVGESATFRHVGSAVVAGIKIFAKSDNCLTFSTRPSLKKHMEIMQFTGLQDRNNKDIYEGDIMRVKYYNGDEVFTEIRYGSDASFHGYKLRGPKDNPIDCQIYSVKFGGSSVEKYEVAGNIYENPELMKTQEHASTL